MLLDMERLKSKRIYLMGMPGCGKSTLGRQLANALEYTFHDLDDEIEIQAGKDINRIFSEDGEEGFREVEARCLKRLTEAQGSKVIATGGGTPCFYQNMEYMNTNGATIFLNVPLEIIVDRLLEQGTDERPLLRNKTATELLGQLHEHFQIRKAHYMKAFIHIEGGSISLESILDELSKL